MWEASSAKNDPHHFYDAFHSKFKAMDIMSTYHGYKNCFITGFLSRGDEDLEIYMDIFYRGDFIYRVRESKHPSGKPGGSFCRASVADLMFFYLEVYVKIKMKSYAINH